MPDPVRRRPNLPSTAPRSTSEDVRAIAPTPETAGRVREALVVLGITVAVLAVVDSGSLLTWARDLAPNALTEAVRLAVYAWHVTMDRFGVADIHPTLKEAFRVLRDL